MAEDKDKGFTVVDRRIKFEETESQPAEKPASAPEEKAEAKPPTDQKPAATETDDGDQGAEGDGFGDKSASSAGEKTASAQRPPLPPVSFSTFALSLHGSALVHLGLIPGPAGQKPQVDLELARHNVDLLEMLKEKTKGNLSADENNLLDNILYELRMVYLEVCKKNQPRSM